MGVQRICINDGWERTKDDSNRYLFVPDFETMIIDIGLCEQIKQQNVVPIKSNSVILVCIYQINAGQWKWLLQKSGRALSIVGASGMY